MVFAKIREYLADKDEFGKKYEITYRGNSSYGTSLGGFLAILANIFFYTYLILALVGLFLDPGYSFAQN